jgi:hypothetical protein
MNIKNFWCDDDLSQYVDSMLFDSGECIAEMECEIGCAEIKISLEVRGKAKVYFGDDCQPYKYPSEFPQALKKLIKANPGRWDTEDGVYVDMNNWFEYIYTVNDKYSDGVMCEWDISKGTPEDIKKEMLEICEWIIEDL